VLGGSLMLDLSVPVLRKLGETPGQIDDTAAMAFFMIGAVHVALMFMVLKVAGTMVSGWEVFGLARRPANDGDRMTGTPMSPRPAPAVAPALLAPAHAASSPAPSRDIRVARAALPSAANDTAIAGSTHRETRIMSGGGMATAAGGNPSVSRARGIGSRFRTAPQKTSLARSTEKFR
jgi:type IV secretion system protein VirB6